MSKFTGTPGPWEISELIVNSNGERTGVFIAKTGGGIVGQSYINCTVYDLDASFRNARLMAASPDLLAALQLIISYHDDGNCELHSEDVAMARAAISKALGEE